MQDWLEKNEFITSFPACYRLLTDCMHKIPDWQIALPTLACVAAGGLPADGTIVSAAWLPAFLASEIFDKLEDGQFIPDQFAASPEITMNLATSFIFLAFNSLTSIRDLGRAKRAARIFSEAGLDAARGQHTDLTKTPASVQKSLDEYWEMVFLKSGSVFRTATAAGAAVGTPKKKVIEALGDYGMALGVMLQLLDDCRDLFSRSAGLVTWEISLPLLLYLMIQGQENITYPEVSSKTEMSDLFTQAGVINTVSSILLDWKDRALIGLRTLPNSPEKSLLERIPSVILEQLNAKLPEVFNGIPA